MKCLSITREQYNRLEEIVLYVFGLSLFINEKLMSNLPFLMIAFLIIRKFVYKEKLECGNERLKKFLIFFLVVGTCWNFIGGMSYKPARAFLKMERYLVLVFYIYPMVKREKKILRNFLIVSILGYLYLLKVVVVQYFQNIDRVPGIEDVNTTGLIGAVVGSIAGSMAIGEEKTLKKIGYTLLLVSGIFVTIATKGRGPLVSIFVALFFSLVIYIFVKKKFKNILITILIGILTLTLFYKTIPQEKLNRFNNIFNTEQSVNNSSNGLRVEMWKNAIWRAKQKPIFGSGTKFDKDKLFQKYIENMPEETNVQKYYKGMMRKNFDDAHNMYLNALVDNGAFILMLLILWFGIPGYLLFKIKDIEDKNMPIAYIIGIISFEAQGLFWPIWRKPNQSIFWTLLALAVVLTLRKEEDKK